MPRPPVSGRPPGFALLEVMVALALLVVALVAVAGLATVAARANRSSHVRSLASLLAAQKMEQMLALAWGYGAAGDVRTDVSTDLAAWPDAEGGGGVGEAPDGTLTSNVVGFVDYLDANGRWVGAGSTPAVNAAYIRRWSVRALPDSPLDTLVFRVVVLPLASAAYAAAGDARASDLAQLTCIRSRRGT